MHNLEKLDGKWYCQSCQQSWKSKPQNQCPGVPVLNWGDAIAPDEITSLEIDKKHLKLKEGATPVGVRIARKGRIWDWVYLKMSD